MRKLMWFVIGFCGACAIGVYCYGVDLLQIAALLMAAAVVLAVAAMWVRHVRIAAVAAVGLSFGLIWFFSFDYFFLADARELDGATVETTVIVYDYSYDTGYGSAVDGIIEYEGKTYRVRVYLDDDKALEPGNRIHGSFRFRFTAEGGIDEVLYHRGQGIFLIGYQQDNVLIERCWSAPLFSYPAIWRQGLKNIIDRCFPADGAAFSKALLLGDRSGLDYETTTAFKVSGISHIIAVSGLHVSILFGLVDLLAGKRRGLTAAIGIPLVLIFAAVAGFTPSVTRAAVMQCLVMLALLFEKEYDGLTALAFAALVILVVNPLTVVSVSFQLSFACMTGIFVMGEPIRKWLLDRCPKVRFVKGICSSVSVSLGATVFTTPLVAIYFGTVSLIGVVTNLVTLWAVSLIFYGIMAVCAIGLINIAAGSLLAGLVSFLIQYVLWTAKTLSSFPLAAVYTKSGYIVAWLVYAYAMLAVYVCIRRKPAALFVSLVGFALGISITLSWVEPAMDECRVTVLDVGQGQSVILQAEGKTFLVDCGGDTESGAADMAAETLLSMGISRLDGIVLTHYDRDHSGGVDELLTRIDTDAVFLPHSLDETGAGDLIRSLVGECAVEVWEDLTVSFEGGELALFAPISYNSGNESSMSVLFRTENCAILLTGDMGTAGERLLMKYHELPQVDVLVVGHHGSKTSTSQALLEAVRPAYALISVGANNYYGHPADAVLLRLDLFGCIIYRTDENGTITFRR